MNAPAGSETLTRSDDAVIKSGASVIQRCVEDLVDRSEHRSDFLRLLADELRTTFRLALVAVESSQWPSSMMLVSDEALSGQIDRDAVRSLLDTAAIMPIACDVPRKAFDGNQREAARGLRVEVTTTPNRCALLLIYAAAQRPTAVDQIRDLKKLGEYVESTRTLITQLPIDEGTSEAASPLQTTIAQTPAVTGNHRHALRHFHRDLDLDATSYRIANESRRLLGSDRTTLLIPQGGRYRAKAVSGVSVVDTRSNSIRAIETLSRHAVILARPLFLPTEEPLPPQIQEPLDEYLDESGVMSVIMLPLHAPEEGERAEGIEAEQIDPFTGNGEILGVMALEYFSGQAPRTIQPAMTVVATEATLSLRNVMEHRQVFGLSLWKAVGRVVHSGRMPLVISGMLLATVLLFASLVIQVQHHVIATGTVEPTLRRQIFAAVDGVVKTVHVTDGQQVLAGDPLLELENAELESRLESLTGEIQTASKRLSAIGSVRLSSENDARQSTQFALEEGQLQSKLANLLAQQSILSKQQDELMVTSPIDGTVVAWQIERRLIDRPVSRGNLMLSVVDHHGPWSLRLHVPDRDAGPILQAAKNNAVASLAIKFAVATEPESSFAATLESVATATRLSAMGEHVIDATATINPVTINPAQSSEESISDGLDPFRAEDVRVGADVTARIACGKRSVLKSWFSDVFAFVHRNVLFYFR